MKPLSGEPSVSTTRLRDRQQVGQIQLLLLRGKWAAGEEELQGAVCLHLQVTRNQT